MLNMMLGEVSPGGVGTGLYGMLVVAVITVFVAGLMVGRTPEYLGKKIGAARDHLAALVDPDHARPRAASARALALALAGRAGGAAQHRAARAVARCSTRSPRRRNNNGSAFAGLTADQPFLNLALAVCDAARPASCRSCSCSPSPAPLAAPAAASRRPPARMPTHTPAVRRAARRSSSSSSPA